MFAKIASSQKFLLCEVSVAATISKHVFKLASPRPRRLVMLDCRKPEFNLTIHCVTFTFTLHVMFSFVLNINCFVYFEIQHIDSQLLM